jgi:hypothetical protein
MGLPEAAMAIVAAVVVTQLFLWAYNAPINALLVNSVSPSLRARAVGLSILSIHLLGDALSPSLTVVPVTIALGAAIWIFGWRSLPARSAAQPPG